MLRPTSRSLVLVLALAALAGPVALSCGDDVEPGDRPEPGSRVDAGVEVGELDGNSAGCPEGPPKIGENCPMPQVTEETCVYVTGTCMINNETFERRASYRCHMGTWHAWDTDQPMPCP